MSGDNPADSGLVRIVRKEIVKALTIKPHSRYYHQDLTPQIAAFAKEHDIDSGRIDISCLHTTAGLVKQEYELLLIAKDIPRVLNTLVPEAEYAHDDFELRENVPPDEPKNARAHIMASLITVPDLYVKVRNRELVLGKWQSVIFLDFDGMNRTRTVQLSYESFYFPRTIVPKP